MSQEKPGRHDVLFLENLRREFALWFARNLPMCAYGFSLADKKLKVSLRPPNVEDPNFRSLFIELQGRLELSMRLRGRKTEDILYDVREIGEVQALSPE